MKKLAIILFFLCLGMTQVQAQIVTYSMSGLSGITNSVSGTADPNVTASVLGRESGLGGVSGADAFVSSGYPTTGTLSITDCVAFSVTGATGYNLNATTLTFDDFISSQGPTTIEVLYQIGSNSPVSLGTHTPSSAQTTRVYNVNQSNVPSPTSLKIFICGYSATSGSGNNKFVASMTLA